MKKKLGIIGCGMMGQEHIRNFHLLKNNEITDIFEPNETIQKQIIEFLPQVRFRESLDDLLQNTDLDALLIASPNFCHAEQLLRIQEIKHLPILVEKPVCVSLEQVFQLKKFAASYTSPVWVAMEYRYMPPIQALIQEAKKQDMGKIVSLFIREHRFPFLEKVGNWNRFNKYTGGTLVEKCCHFFDLMCHIFQSEPSYISASGAQDVNHLKETYQGEHSDILDNAFVIVDFESGQRACLELCMFAEGSEYQEEISLVGSRGKLESFVPGPTRFWNTNLGSPPVPKLIFSPRSPKGPVKRSIPVDPALLDAGDHNGSTFYQDQKFISLLDNKQSIEVSLEDGIRSVLMGLAAQKSLASKQVVNMQDFQSGIG